MDQNSPETPEKSASPEKDAGASQRPPRRRSRPRAPEAPGQAPGRDAPPLSVVSGPAPSPAPELAPILEAILFAAEQPIPLPTLREFLPDRSPREIEEALSALRVRYGAPHGVRLVEVASGLQLRTAPEYREYVALSLKSRPQRLSRAALETLAIVAYRQPLTRAEIDEIRGVDSGGALKTLLERRLLRILGRKEEPGRPVLYGTSREFLEFFGLRDLNSLPSLSEFRALSEEEEASELGKPEEAPLLPSLASRKKGEVPAEVVDNLEEAMAEVDRLTKTLPIPREEEKPKKGARQETTRAPEVNNPHTDTLTKEPN